MIKQVILVVTAVITLGLNGIANVIDGVVKFVGILVDSSYAVVSESKSFAPSIAESSNSASGENRINSSSGCFKVGNNVMGKLSAIGIAIKVHNSTKTEPIQSNIPSASLSLFQENIIVYL